MLITRKTNLPDHIVQFVQFLRTHNFICGVGEERDLLKTLSQYMPAQNTSFQNLCSSILVKKKNEEQLFDELFTDYWRELEKAVDSKVVEAPERQQQKRRKAPTIYELKNWLFAGRVTEVKEVAAYADIKAFSEKDFTHFSEDDQKDINELIHKLAHHFIQTRHRRWQSSKQPNMLDLRRTLRKNLSSDMDFGQRQWKSPKKGRQKVTIICDFSKSMELYVRFFLQFMYGFYRLSVRVETFTFGTSLQRVTKVFVDNDFKKSMQALSDYAEEWAGGTRIGYCLEQFIVNYGSSYLDRSTYVIMVSDGWDQGNLDLLEEKMAYIYRKAKEVIWINPLAGHPDYQPKVGGMKVAMPYIDHFASAHNLSSLVKLIQYLGERI